MTPPRFRCGAPLSTARRDPRRKYDLTCRKFVAIPHTRCPLHRPQERSTDEH